jgi:hypothetical protein
LVIEQGLEGTREIATSDGRACSLKERELERVEIRGWLSAWRTRGRPLLRRLRLFLPDGLRDFARWLCLRRCVRCPNHAAKDTAATVITSAAAISSGLIRRDTPIEGSLLT